VIDSSIIAVGILFLVLQIQFERVPFDVVEAESELIDGVTVELEGFVFSLAYAGEVVCFLIALKMLLGTSGFSVVVLCFLIFYSFIGRIALARLLLADIVEALLAIALTAAPMILAILGTSR
jgi:NADH:ubiquinone oxidoreductase subunit H